jgi:SNF2 family DNA or RNA helicase
MRKDLQLMPFQDKGSDRLAGATRAMLVWDPGVGKTPTAVRACVKIGARRVLVFCPPVVTSVWVQHFKDWSDYRDIRVLAAPHTATPYTWVEGKGVRIVPYSYCTRDYYQRVMNAASRFSDQWDAVILDEAHYLKNSGAKRTRAVYGDKLDLKGSPCEEARHIWALTGTPILNHPGEFWTHLHALMPELIQMGGKTLPENFYIDRYCVTRATPYGVRVVGSKNTHELSEKIKPLIDRKRLKDVLPDMPELRIVEYPLPADTPIFWELREEIEKLTKELEVLSDEELLAGVQAGAVAFSTARRLIGHIKLENTAQLVENELEGSDEKLIVFCHHRAVIETLAERLKKFLPLVIHGGTSVPDRAKIIDAFQTHPAHRLIILAIEAAGEGITLHAAHNVIIAEPSPVPSKNAQAIARAHRKGQGHPVVAKFVLLPGTIDARLMALAARKTRDIMKVIDPDLATPEKPQRALFPEDV